MAEILHLSALLPALVSACCTVGAARTRGAGGVISAIVMLAAMLDLTGGGVLPPLAWSVLLVASALAAGVTARVAGATHGDPMAAHAALGLVVMAGLVMLMGGAAGGLGHLPVSAHSPHAAAGPLAGTVWTGTVAYLVFSGALVARRATSPRHAAGEGPSGSVPGGGSRSWRRDRLEITGMAASVMLMAAALLP